MWAWKHTHQADGSVDYIELKGDVVFDDVNFGYNPDKIVLHNVDLYATPGQKIAFVGSTGAGKTTITNLINRFYDIQDGKIRYDGININKIKKDDLRHSLGIVLQDTHLFTATVMENIRYGKLDATDEEVIAAAKLANADTFIHQLPDGYNTLLTGDGANLSQGQRQLLAIARAAIADPPVLILDEATSSIDTRTEKIVQDGMDKLMAGRTTFVIAHRLSTVKNSDCIIVLEQGRVIERGNHDNSWKKKENIISFTREILRKANILHEKRAYIKRKLYICRFSLHFGSNSQTFYNSERICFLHGRTICSGRRPFTVSAPEQILSAQHKIQPSMYFGGTIFNGNI